MKKRRSPAPSDVNVSAIVHSATQVSKGVVETEVACITGQFEAMTAHAQQRSAHTEQAAQTAMVHAQTVISEAHKTHQKVEDFMQRMEASTSQKTQAAASQALQVLSTATVTQQQLSAQIQNVDTKAQLVAEQAKAAKTLVENEKQCVSMLEQQMQKRVTDTHTLAEHAAAQVKAVETKTQTDVQAILQQMQQLVEQAVKQQQEYTALKTQMAAVQSTLEVTQSQLQAERATVTMLQEQQSRWLEEESAAMQAALGQGEEGEEEEEQDDAWNTALGASKQQDPQAQAQDQGRLQKAIEDLQNSLNAAMLSKQASTSDAPVTGTWRYTDDWQRQVTTPVPFQDIVGAQPLRQQ